MKIQSTLLAVLVGVGFTHSNAAANDASVAMEGATVRLLEEADVRMVEEKLVFSFVGDDVWQADLTYVFHNRGQARTLRIGLPFHMPDPDDEHHGASVDEDIEGFETRVDGKAVEHEQLDDVTSVGDIAFNRVYAVEVDFEADQTRTLTHRYRVPLTVAAAGGPQSFDYLLRTGAGWAGTIGKMAIDFQLPPDAGPCVVSRLPAERDGDWLRVRLEDLEPELDFEVLFQPRADLLPGVGLYPWRDDLDEVCGDALDADPDVRRATAARVRLLYGAPTTGVDEAIVEAGPLEMCTWADTFNALVHHIPDEELTATDRHYRDALLELTWRQDARYPDTMPPLLRECVDKLEAAE